ncbi:MAG: NADH-quinone oxidoreductase subunit N [Actinomycetota bacterium]
MNVAASTPIIIMSGASVLALVFGVLPWRTVSRVWPSLAAVAGIGAAGGMSIALWGDRQTAYAGNLYADRFAMLVNVIVLLAALATIALSWREPGAVDRRGEYAALILLSTTGMMMVAGAGNLIVLFLGVELLSVALYVLCAMEAWRERSLESGLKYLIVGAVGSAFLLYGLAFLYGATGSTSLAEIGERLFASSLTDEPFLAVAVALIVAGLGFKASAVPFHMWTPDVYEGAPTPVTAFMATATKAAAFAAFLRLFAGTLPDLLPDWQVAIGVIAGATMIIGNVAALLQTNLKRMLAYSGVAQAGYLLIGVAAGGLRGAEAVLYYLIAYLVMTVAAFAVVLVREREVADGDELTAFTGFGRARPLLGGVMTVAMLSLAGFPPLSGFVGKFLLFSSAVEADLVWLAILGAVGSMISLGYYLRVATVLWLTEPDAAGSRKVLRVPASVGSVAVTSGVAVIGLAVSASLVLDVCRGAAEALLAP